MDPQHVSGPAACTDAQLVGYSAASAVTSCPYEAAPT